MANETSGDVRAWLRAAHPFRNPRTLDEATRAARAGAWALALYALVRFGDAAALVIWREAYVEALATTLARLGPAEAVAPALALVEGMGVAAQAFGAIAAGVAALAFAGVQWRWPSPVLPALLALLILYDLLTLAAAWALDLAAPLPWPFYGGLPATVAALVLALAGFRGGLARGRLKRAAPAAA